MLRKVLSVLGFSVLLASAASADVVIKCDFPKSPNGWVDGPVVFSLKDGEKTAAVGSVYSQVYSGGLVEATVKMNDPKMIVLKWSIKMKNAANQYTTMSYRLLTPPGGGKGEYHADPAGYDSSYYNTGPCAKVK